MQASIFIEKWRSVELKERSASHAHFIDLCHLLDVEDPVTADPKGGWFAFEKGAAKTPGGEGWADVWRKDCFAWEYKGKRKDLDKAFIQLQQYAIALENPPLLIVSDMDQIRIHTNWTNTVQKVHKIALEDLTDAAVRDTLHYAFVEPERLRPAKTRQVLTEEAAKKFVSLAQRLRDRGHDSGQVAHFINRLVFCMFAEDVRLLPNRLFEKMLAEADRNPADFALYAKTLFGAMNKPGGRVGFEKVDWFNGGLFDDDTVLPLEKADITDLRSAALLDWSDIDPSILGTLFERGLDPSKRSQLGAHYTDRDKIMQIVNPVIVEPLLAEWDEIKARIMGLLERAGTGTSPAASRARNDAQRLKVEFMERLLNFRVLDPACGSGNFLYIALLELKNIEHRVNLEAEALGFPREFPRIGPEAVMGIELNPYAAELARVSVWIGEIQWMRRNGFEAARNPILRTLNNIENRDAVLNPDGTCAEWPKADVVVGNPPFLGSSKFLTELGENYSSKLRAAWNQTVPGAADLMAYWFAKSWRQMQANNLTRAGLVSTNSIRGGANREVLKPIVDNGQIFEAWADEDWTVDGAAVRVSLICFDKTKGEKAKLEGSTVPIIHADLTGAGLGTDLTKAASFAENKGVCFEGFRKYGPLNIDGDVARGWLKQPININHLSNSEILKPYVGGRDITDRPSDTWVIDYFGYDTETAASFFEIPFHHARANVKPYRDNVRDKQRKEKWWQFGRSGSNLRTALKPLSRMIVTPRVSKYRLFCWHPLQIRPSDATNAIARDDDTTFGILHSYFHEIWSLRMGTFLGVGNDPRYTPSTTFETFPFPEGLTPNIPAADYADDPRAIKIAESAARLNELRENWLNPPDLIERVPEVVPGYPDRLLPKDAAAEVILKKRTLTNLYNQRPAWLNHAHKALDEAVAEAYGWGDDWRAGLLTDDEILARLFRLNQERAG